MSVPGRQVRHPLGYRYFVPNPLPPHLEWDADLASILSEADYNIGRLAAEGRGLPNPHLLLRPFIRREAVDSSRIEGTQATLGELLAAEAGAAVERAPGDLKEVGNYVVAMERGLDRLRKGKITLGLVRDLHRTLMTGVHEDRAKPGEFRTSQNWIGPPFSNLRTATYVPPAPGEMRDGLQAWAGFLKDRSLPPLVQIALLHYQFEAIHPFLDGNGRVGRLLIILFLVQRGILPAPLLYLSAYFDATRPVYYAGLRGVTQTGNWYAWLRYFLTAVSVQADDAIRRAERINALLGRWQRDAGGSSSSAESRILELLAENPFLILNRATQRLNVAFSTVMRAMERLEKRKIIEEVSGRKRDRVYCAKKLLAILEEPPRITPASEN